MRTKKTSAPPQGYTVNALAELTGIDRRTIKRKVLDGKLVAVGQDKGSALYDLKAFEAVLRKEASTPGGISLRDQKLTEEIRRLRLKNDKEAEKLIDLAKNDEWLLLITKEVASILYQKLVSELPTAAAGLGVPEIRILSKRFYNMIATSIRKLIEKPELKKLLEKHESDIAI